MLGFLRIIKFTFQNIGRNVGLSVMTVLILVLMLLSVNSLITVRALTQEASDAVKEQIDISVYFDQEVKDEEVAEVEAYVNSFEEVKEVTLFSRDEVLTEFTDKHKDNQDIISSIEELGENPFGPRMTIKTHETEDYATITEALSVPEYDQVIEAKTFADTEKTIQKIQLITSQVERFSALLSGLFGAIAFIVIFNTIRIAIYTQRTEISIKKLVGATDWFVKGPYMLSSLFFSLLSVIISFALTLLAIRFLDPYIMSIFNDPHFLTNYYFSHILVLAGIELGAVLILTILSSSLAMRKYLRV